MLKYFTTLKSDEITSVAIGGFDGFHVAHQKLATFLDSGGVLFVIDKGFSNLSCFRECEIFANGCIVVKLHDIKDMTKDEFVDFLKSSFINLKRVVVGYDFRFGKDREGSCEDFKNQFEVVVVDEVFVDGVSVHSQTIREFLKSGDILMANKLLGREYEIEFFSTSGLGLGKQKLVPTINLVPNRCLLPKEGVYATKTKIDDKYISSITFIGKRDSVDGSFSIETHLLDTNLNYLPLKVQISFLDFVRDNKRFDTLEGLKKQIEKDIEFVRKSFDKK